MLDELGDCVEVAEQLGAEVCPGFVHKSGHGHATHELAPRMSLNVPAGQGVGFTEETGQKEPAGQMTGAPEEQ